jgi:hypothetical protein
MAKKSVRKPNGAIFFINNAPPARATARRRIDVENLLEGLVAFAFAEPKTPATERRFLREALAAWRSAYIKNADRELSQWSPTQLEAFRREVQAFLQDFVVRIRTVPSPPGLFRTGDDTVTAPARQREVDADLKRVRRELHCVTLVDDPLETWHENWNMRDRTARDELWDQIFRILMSVGEEGMFRIRPCPGCKRVFLKKGRREYCGEQCQAKVYMRGRRARGQA